MRHGPRDLALVSADARRFGAHEQVARIGRLLGAPTFATDQLSELPRPARAPGEAGDSS